MSERYANFRVVLLTQFGANYLSQMVASITDISKVNHLTFYLDYSWIHNNN
jgi:hypothetical protein